MDTVEAVMETTKAKSIKPEEIKDAEIVEEKSTVEALQEMVAPIVAQEQTEQIIKKAMNFGIPNDPLLNRRRAARKRQRQARKLQRTLRRQRNM